MDNVAYVGDLQSMNEPAADVSQTRTNCRMRLLSSDFRQRLCEGCFHPDSWIESQSVVDKRGGDFFYPKAHDVDVSAKENQSDLWLLSVGNVGRGVQCNGIPNEFGL
jgi:hypothetical protein